MHHTNQALNELYQNLLINAPQTVSVEIPPDLGTGQITQTETKQGIVLSDWRTVSYTHLPSAVLMTAVPAK